MAPKSKPKACADVNDNDTSLPEEPIAPDGGWGWVILFASFISSVIVDGVCFAFGIFYLEFLSYFNGHKGKTAWIGSVLNGTYMIMGPIAGALANKFGCRAVAITGSLWAAAAFFLSTFSPSVDALILTYGVLGGIGFGLMYLPSIVIVGFYFDKKRAFATGVATCGSGIGAFVFAPLCKYLIENYSWKGAQWIVSGMVLNGIVLGALYRPLTFKELEKMRKKWRRKHGKYLEIEKESVSSTYNSDTSSDEVTLYIDPRKNNGIEPPESPNMYDKSSNGYADHTNMLVNGEPKYKQIMHSNGTQGVRKRTVSTGLTERSKHDLHEKFLGESWHSLSGYAASMDNIPGRCNGDQSVSKSSQSDNSTGCLGILKDIHKAIKDTMDFSMMLNPVFFIYSLSCILCMAGFFVPFIYLPDNALGLGYDMSQAAFLLSILGITNTVGRVIAGWVSDRPWADCLFINNIALIVGGVATIFCPFCKTYAMLCIYACIFGLCIAAFVSLRSIILVDLIGLDKLTSAFGIIVLCQGLTSFVGAPIAGFLFDITGTYNLSFYLAGTTIALAGAINLPLRKIARWHNKRVRRKEREINIKNTKEGTKTLENGESTATVSSV